MAALDSARSSAPVASGPITRRRLPSSTCMPGPCLRQAMSATKLKASAAHGSGTRQSADQPSAYATPVSLALKPGTVYLRDLNREDLPPQRPATAETVTSEPPEPCRS